MSQCNVKASRKLSNREISWHESQWLTMANLSNESQWPQCQAKWKSVWQTENINVMKSISMAR